MINEFEEKQNDEDNHNTVECRKYIDKSIVVISLRIPNIYKTHEYLPLRRIHEFSNIQII